jgi:DNA-binding HxlR family transcriptional regulator
MKPARDIPPVGNCDVAICVSRDVLAKLATKWAPLVMRQLARGDKRYSELRGAIEGISEKMLAQTLRELERDGLVVRMSYDVVPPHVVYSLSPLGKECAPLVARSPHCGGRKLDRPELASFVQSGETFAPDFVTPRSNT